MNLLNIICFVSSLVSLEAMFVASEDAINVLKRDGGDRTIEYLQNSTEIIAQMPGIGDHFFIIGK